ncbi:LysR substrate-binding domain-containing protein [Aestuariispira insulae]|uniref:LysR family transcriptional regulator n=1 Tax=Aestuariispira insulae TaxID=1461337 RepID=A0A3D9H9L7_9PROT|nr:LysR substrate-binding domain-containing protein [Aestuariispira insulae]RED46184.1 LysR family transcriptional regulator [Aestuariispira insulae]
MNALAVFECAGRTGSFTRAAEELGTSQPAVSRHIANLEDHLGVALFDRHHNRIVLSPEGCALHEAVALGLGHIQSVFQEIRRSPYQIRTLTIGCSYGLAHLYLMPYFAAIQEAFPAHEVRLITTDSYADLERSDADYSIRYGTGQWPGRAAVSLFRENVFPVCAPEFLSRHPGLKDPQAWRDLADYPLLHLDAGQRGWLVWESWLEQAGARPLPPGKRVSRSELYLQYPFLLQAAMEGRGVALGWSNMVDRYLENGQLVRIGRQSVETERGYFLVSAGDSPEDHDLVRLQTILMGKTVLKG